MFRVTTGASLGLRCGLAVLACTVAVLSLSSTDADARGKRKFFKRNTAATSTMDARYADIVVDANTGDVLHATNADAIRYPASLTKIMTLYLLFEQLEAGRVKLDTQMEVSEHAASQAPTKLGLRPGQTLMVEDAIKALVTKSANDASVVIAEHIAGSEDEFARLMTRKARALRMTRTVYRNANGLPDPGQVTTARDQALLGLAIQDRFPRYYRYFATQSFVYRGVRMSNHNRLLGRVPGVHGIKTGYIRASGFNLVSAVQRGDRRIVAVVLGGASAGSRDAKMRSLIDQKIVLASTTRTAPKIVEVADAAAPKPVLVAAPTPRPEPQARPEKPVRLAAANPPAKAEAPQRKPEARTAERSAKEPEQPVPGSTEPIKPLLVKTFSVKAGNPKTVTALSMLSPEPLAARTALSTDASGSAENARTETESERLPPPPPGARPGVLGVLSAKDMTQPPAQPVVTASVTPMVPTTSSAMTAPAPVKSSAPLSISDRKPRGSGWIIQVGAFEAPDEAREKLADAKSKAGNLLKGAEPYTEVYAKGDKRFYRARFAGLNESAAEQACKELKRSKIACFTTRN
ncbi:serine hydrolase [Pseudorhodoplanes sp.]|uniref:serine hydrolase n=1 Tax=Pseudorhodoplanes sp. TaxID=1934341 RepID=UPI002C8F236F|nr:serine hydrolase [Pseudorhodoplanes sp.]HWV43719.1 serine hydrolase [Pseudorhodoplanes sp.]